MGVGYQFFLNQLPTSYKYGSLVVLVDVFDAVADVLLDERVPFDGYDHVAEGLQGCDLVGVEVVAIVVLRGCELYQSRNEEREEQIHLKEYVLGGYSIGFFDSLKLGDLAPSLSFVCLSPSRLLLGLNFG